MTEHWKPVKGFEGSYEVSDQGRVRSVTRSVTDVNGITRTCRGKLRALCTSKSGYKTCSLGQDGRLVTCSVHRLVLEAFIGLCPSGKEAAHFDGDGCNNRLNNLRWCTHSSNQQDKVRHGTNSGGKKLTVVQVRELRDECSRVGKSSTRVIGKRYGVSVTTVRSIIRGITWAGA